MYHCTLLLTVLALGFPAQAEDTRARFEELARQMEFFPTGEFAYGRGEQLDRRIPKKLTDPWLKVLAGISTGKDTADLAGLLKHEDAKVRTLALAALFQKEDPKLLPQLAAMMGDKEKTVPELAIRRASAFPAKGERLMPQDFHEQTVGHVAKVLVEYWLRPAGYEAKDFASYWDVRKDRAFCASWFLVRLYRAGQATSAFDKDRAPLIRAVRKEVDALPPVDRDWTLLWLAAHHYQSLSSEPARIFATPDEQLEAGKRLGPPGLMDLIQDKAISSDPDLAPKETRTRGRDDLILWVLHRAGKLLRPEDAPAILAAEPTLRDRPPACVVAAAELQPDSARRWLREAFSRYAGDGTHLGYHRAELAAGLWSVLGESEIDYLADWFYGEKVATNPHTPQTQASLHDIQTVRAPANRKLVARLVTDPRLDKLDYQSLRALVEVANGWSKSPAVPPRDLYPNWQHGDWSPKSTADFKVLAGWRGEPEKECGAVEPMNT